MIQTLSHAVAVQEEIRKDSRPHVLLVVDQFPKTLGGGERIVLKLAALLPQYGYRASIMTFSVHPESTVLESPPCPIYLLPLHRTYDRDALRGAFCFRHFLREHKVRIVQTFFESSDIWAGLVTKTVPGVKLIWSRRDMGILRTRKHQIAYRMMANMPDLVFAVSDQVRRHCIEVDHVDAARVETVYNGLNLADWAGSHGDYRGRGAQVVLTIGNIRHVKGHDVLVRAAAYLRPRFPHVAFRVAGDVLEPAYLEELEDLVKALGVSDCFHFLGGSKDLVQQLQEADVFVLPSRSEGFSNAIIEAMAASVPVVATDVGGNAEAVQDGISGIIVPPGDPKALAEGIAKVLRDPVLAGQMGRASRKSAMERFTTESMMARITRAYSKLLKD